MSNEQINLDQLEALARAIKAAGTFVGTREAFDEFQRAANPAAVLELIAMARSAPAAAVDVEKQTQQAHVMPPTRGTGGQHGTDTADFADTLQNCAMMLDTIKIEWSAQGCWSEHDQGVREKVSACLAALATPIWPLGNPGRLKAGDIRPPRAAVEAVFPVPRVGGNTNPESFAPSAAQEGKQASAPGQGESK
jgi:hypothetical protein